MLLSFNLPSWWKLSRNVFLRRYLRWIGLISQIFSSDAQVFYDFNAKHFSEFRVSLPHQFAITAPVVPMNRKVNSRFRL